MNLSKALMTIAAMGTLTIGATAPAHATTKGQDRPGSQCLRTNSDGSHTGGSCGTVCKDKDLTTATGENQASGYQYTCTAAMIIQGGVFAGTGGVMQGTPNPVQPPPVIAPAKPMMSRAR